MIKTAITIGNENQKITDRDVFEYVREKMLAQNQKSTNTFYDEEQDEIVDTEDCQYFSYDHEKEIDLRCALGFVMNQDIFNDIGEENTDATDENILQTIALSNSNWEITSESWQMLALLQRIHDMTYIKHWRRAMDRMSYLFDSNGKFQNDNIVVKKDSNLENLEPREVTVDFEELGIKFNVKVPNMDDVQKIANLLDRDITETQFVKHLNKDVVNILNVETQEQQSIGSNIFLDLVEAVNQDIRQSNQEKAKV
ncbi:hypothetical protein EB001_00385 [bacterium]|nr:hypothetical protein [bacterium]